MSAPDIGVDIIGRFSGYAGGDPITIVLGAGASQPSGLPSWDEFAIRSIIASGLLESYELAQAFVMRQDPGIILESAKLASGDRWDDVLGSALFGAGTQPLYPSPLHKAAVDLYMKHKQTTNLCTLNYDEILEEEILLREPGDVLINIGENHTDPDDQAGSELDSDDLEDGVQGIRSVVHHRHGVYHEGKGHSMIVGMSDYAELMAKRDSWQRAFLGQAVDNGWLLLAGTSYRDPDMRQWLHEALVEQEPQHAPLVTLARQSLQVSKRRFDLLSDALRAQWEAIGLSAILVQDLADIATVIGELDWMGKPGYRTPQERARHAWNTLDRHFEALQHEFARQLEDDERHIQEAMGVAAHRATLWISDGRGKLVKWCSSGGINTRKESLRKVPTGHDSVSIAGEVLATEEVAVKDVLRSKQLDPKWQSVLAIPVKVTDGKSPGFAYAVVSFGLSPRARRILRKEAKWSAAVTALQREWEIRLSDYAFGVEEGRI